MRAFVVAAMLLVSCEEVPPCEDLGESECHEQHECMWSTVTRYRLNDGACEVVRTGAACYDRVMVSAGCAGLSCGESGIPAPWYRTERDGGASLAEVECGSGIVGWDECSQPEEGFEPPICACACE